MAGPTQHHKQDSSNNKKKKKWIPWAERPDRDQDHPPDPWTEWYEYYDPRPVPYPRRCKCCKQVFKKRDIKAELRHMGDCICSTTLRIYPLFLDSDRWEPVPVRHHHSSHTNLRY